MQDCKQDPALLSKTFVMHNYSPKILFCSVSEIPPTVLSVAQKMNLPVAPFHLKRSTVETSILAEQQPDIILTDSGSIARLKQQIPCWIKEKKPILVFGTIAKNKPRKQDIVSLPQTTVRNGMIFCPKLSILLNLAKAFCAPFRVSSPGVTILTNSGSMGVLASDLCETAELYLTKPDETLLQQLQMHLSRYTPLYNPIQIPPKINQETFKKVFSALVQSKRTANLLLLLTPTGDTEGLSQLPEIIKESEIPVHICLTSPSEWKGTKKSFFQAGYPSYESPDSAVQSIRILFDFYSQKDKNTRTKKEA